MNLTSPSQVKAWCIEHDFHPNKTLGQNFLIDRNILEAIVDAGLDGVAQDEPILEIGPGLGVMTQELLRRGHDVIAIEKDTFLSQGLEERVRSEAAKGGRLVVVTADALDVIGPRAKERGPRDDAQELGANGNSTIPQFHNSTIPQYLISNLPYQAGTRILLEMVQARRMKSMTVLLQTEVAERLAAKEGGRDRSLAGVWAQLDYDVSIVRKVGANCFWPRPEVGSSVAKLVRHERNASLDDEERKIFHSITKQAFAHRRKQLGTIFKGQGARAKERGPRVEGQGPRVEGQEMSETLNSQLSTFNSQLSTLMQRRPEQLSIDEWILLAKGMKNGDD